MYRDMHVIKKIINAKNSSLNKTVRSVAPFAQKSVQIYPVCRFQEQAS